MTTTNHTHAPSCELLEELRSNQNRLGGQLKKLENFGNPEVCSLPTLWRKGETKWLAVPKLTMNA